MQSTPGSFHPDMMKILPNGIAVLEGDFLSGEIEKRGQLCIEQDGVVSQNLSHIRPGDWVVEGGAFIGDHTACYLYRVGPTGRVIAFEPNPAPLECLRHNCPTAEIHQQVLSDRTEEVAFKADTLPNLGGGFVGSGGNIKVQAIRLDDMQLSRLNLIKLDIEGYELRALMGATETICRCSPVIQMEWIPAALERAGHDPMLVMEWFRICGYEYHFFMGDIRSGEIIALPTKRC